MLYHCYKRSVRWEVNTYHLVFIRNLSGLEISCSHASQALLASPSTKPLLTLPVSHSSLFHSKMQLILILLQLAHSYW